jgi:hypothetical protein
MGGFRCRIAEFHGVKGFRRLGRAGRAQVHAHEEDR